MSWISSTLIFNQSLITHLENKNVLHHTFYFQHCRILLFLGIHCKVNTAGCKNSGNLWNLDAIL